MSGSKPHELSKRRPPIIVTIAQTDQDVGCVLNPLRHERVIYIYNRIWVTVRVCDLEPCVLLSRFGKLIEFEE